MTEVEQLAAAVETVLRNTPHDTESPGKGITEPDDHWEIEVGVDAVILTWELDWSGSRGSYAGALHRYFEYDHTPRDDQSGGWFEITELTDEGRLALGLD